MYSISLTAHYLVSTWADFASSAAVNLNLNVSNSVFSRVFSVDKEEDLDVSAVRRPRSSNNSSETTRSYQYENKNALLIPKT